MNWVPIVFIIFKVGVLAIGMFYSIKWHYDQDKSSEPLNLRKFALEMALYLVVVVIIFTLLYEAFRYFHLLPAGLDFG